ncbi:unnamed protein product, partial [Aureobasidium vineae]
NLPRLYNVTGVMTSDIVVRFNGGRSEFLSQKAVLSAKSGYFERAFSGNFPVATSDVIDLGDDDNPKHIYAMLCFLHGTDSTFAAFVSRLPRPFFFEANALRIRDMSRLDVWVSKEQRLFDAQREMLEAEAGMGEGPWDASTLAGQIMAARAQNAAYAALSNLALLVPQPTFAPPLPS